MKYKQQQKPSTVSMVFGILFLFFCFLIIIIIF